MVLGTVALEFMLILRLNDSLAGEAGLIPLKRIYDGLLKTFLVEGRFSQKTSLSSRALLTCPKVRYEFGREFKRTS